MNKNLAIITSYVGPDYRESPTPQSRVLVIVNTPSIGDSH